MSRRAPGRRPTHQIVADMHATLVELIATKRAEPGDDLLSALIAARDHGERLSEDELTSMAFLILWAGYETTVNLIANTTAALLTEPEHAALVRAQPSAHTEPMARLVEELTRRDGPMLTAIRRFPLTDIHIGQATIPAGETVLLSVASADHDPQAFPLPELLEAERTQPRHLAYGHGPHYCLGAPLARLEARTALWTLLRRFPDLALAEHLTWKPDYRQHALTTLPVTYTPQPSEGS